MVVKSGIPLTEVLQWDVEDVFKYLAMMERENDYTKAYHAYIQHKSKSESNNS